MGRHPRGVQVSDGPTVRWEPKIYPPLTNPNGPLSQDMAAQACWTFYTRAMSAIEVVGDGPSSQIIYDEQLWMDLRLNAMARGIAKEYGLDSPDDWQPYWPQVIQVCQIMGYPTPSPALTRLTGRDIIL